MKNKTVYYAHSMRIYGTKREKAELRFLRKRFKKVINPSTDIQVSRDIGLYLAVVKNCDVLVCSEYKGHIGKGIFEELSCALKEEKEVKCIRKTLGCYRLKDVLGADLVDATDWIVQYGTIRYRR